MIKIAMNMKRCAKVIIVLILSLLSALPLGAETKTDREQAGLKGPVRTVTTVTDKGRGVITYNLRGDEVEEIYKSSANEFKKMHVYDRQGRRIKTDYYGHGEDTVAWKTKRYNYDAKGKLVQEIYCLSFGCDDKKVYTYDSKGNLTEEALYYPSSDSVKVRLTHTYDSKGHRTQTTAWDAHGPGLGIGETVQKYDAKGKVTESTTYYTGQKAGDEDGIGDFLPYQLIAAYKYNSNGDIIEQTSYDTRSRPGDEDECDYPPCRTIYVYEYDAKGNWTKQTEFSCTRAKSGKYECQKFEGETNRAVTYYWTGTK